MTVYTIVTSIVVAKLFNSTQNQMDDYEDDTHFCLKCHSTIIGLEFYVNHRKNNCMKQPDTTFSTLKADDFFSSLELQSSSKKLIQQSTSGKHSSGILTRSKVTAFKETLEPSKSGKNAWIGGVQEKDSDFDGNFLKTVENNKDVDKSRDISRLQDYADSDAESEDYELEEETSDEDAPPRNHTGGKWKPSSPIYWKHSQSESDWRPPPPSFTGGKWNPSSNKRNFSPPPSNHTRGKWKPESHENEDPPPSALSGGKWGQPKKQEHTSVSPDFTRDKFRTKPVMSIDDFQLSLEPPNEKWSVVELIPSTYTRGKWKPEYSSPEPIPSTYTRGKWKPENSPEPSTSSITKSKTTNFDNDNTGNKEVSAGLIEDQWLSPTKSPTKEQKQTDKQYWCKPCNRRLASKVVYERHLKSEFHTKRTLRENELEENLNFFKTSRGTKRKGESTEADTKEQNSGTKRKRRKIFEKCKVCNSKVNLNLMGKHLISHYHCRKSDLTSESAQSMIFENFRDIIKQSPFQCKPCKYYFNYHKEFLDHWLSEDHKLNTKDKLGEFLCSYCKFSCLENEEMYKHLVSQDHKEVISVINRSVPIIIKKIHYRKCATCGSKFPLLIQLRKHIEKTGHEIMDELNEFKCDICMQNLNSEIALQRHKKNMHKIRIFLCGTCGLTFPNSEEVKKHRNSVHHHTATIEKKNQGNVKSMERKCQYCSSVFDNFLKLKDHIKTNHEEFHPRCPRCGMSFVVSQDLSVHLRTKSCKLEEQQSKKFTCSTCPFSVDSEAHLLFHETLHTEPILMFPDKGSTNDKKATPHYKCPECQKFFPKSSLLGHLRLHTKERPYKCSFCDKTFVRKNNWLFHEKKHTSMKTENKEESPDVNERPFLCSTCGASFRKRFILQQHMKIHTGKSFKCIHKDCIFTGRSLGELKIHFQTHFDERNFPCKSCDYKGKTKQQLARHMTVHEDTKKFKCPSCPFTARTSHHLKRHCRLHTGSKPYNCPHCSYSCNSLENLRKHILSTNKHPGKSIYECKFCKGFQTNFFKEFKAHLLTLHPNEMDKGDKIKSSSVYEAKKDQFFPIGNSNGQLETRETGEPLKNQEEASGQPCSLHLVPLIVSKDDTIDETGSESWSLVGCYDVSESGALIAFNKDILFEDVM
ncbi:zinc finger protein 845-like isoform X2 [Coccinella septempunctata]|uniref:zinc finger protein 845-like isoform X2 n=1 Tax=Coccinella septempunctata TaxID=41139 RepID=UPI001D083E34|nr:zinc finger protein 845-like isoform X2 [Coccinella septempunctata]